MNRYYYIYIITNTTTQKSYVGSRFYDKNEPYWGSSKYLTKDINTYGYDNFSKDIIGIYPFINKDETLERESYYMKEYDTLNPNGYNKYLPNKGFSTAGCTLPESTVEYYSIPKYWNWGKLLKKKKRNAM